MEPTLTGKLVRAALRPLSFTQVRRVVPDRKGAADDRIDRIYQEMERVFGVISPPVALHSPAPDMLAASWVLLYETLLVPGQVSRAAKEAVATAVSVRNECPYCVTVHSTMMQSLDHGKEAAAIAADRTGEIADPQVREISAWALANALPQTAAGHPAPFPAGQAPEIVGTALAFHYFNRVVNVFLPDAPLPPNVPAAMLTVVLPVLSRLMRSASGQTAPAGGSVGLLPNAPLPQNLWWAAGNPDVAQGLARVSGAVEAAGLRSVPAGVRELVAAELVAWDGQPKGPSRAWVEKAISALPAEEQPAGRLALLVALASYQVDETAIDAFQAGRPGDAALVEFVSWAAFTASAHATTWMSIPGGAR